MPAKELFSHQLCVFLGNADGHGYQELDFCIPELSFAIDESFIFGGAGHVGLLTLPIPNNKATLMRLS